MGPHTVVGMPKFKILTLCELPFEDGERGDTYVWPNRFCIMVQAFILLTVACLFPQFCVLYEASRKVLSASFSNLRKTYQTSTSLLYRYCYI